MNNLFFILACALGLTVPAGVAPAVTFESGATQTALLELYTSEGCSSCPPAEAKLARLRDDPGLWKTIVPVAFHVDYWDHLGWPDRFAAKAFTQRQHQYAARWGSSSVYTPAFVLNGRESRGAVPANEVGRLRADVTPDGSVNVTFWPANAPGGALVVEVVPLASGVTSNVRRGENAGRKLTHEFIALDVIHATLEKRGGSWKASLALPSSQAAPAAALAAWVHLADDPAALQAIGGWLKSQPDDPKPHGAASK